MSYSKVIVTGHVIEVWRYDHPPHVADRKPPDDGLTEYLLTGDESYIKHVPEWVQEMRKRRNCRQHSRDARANFRRLVVANFTGRTNFITLTFNREETDVKAANHDFKKFIQRLRYAYGKDFKFAVVVEFQKSGRIHYHMLADLGLTWQNEAECKQMERDFARDFWQNGFVDLKDVGHVDNLGAYMSKYMVKRLDDERLAGLKAYRTSRNMARPVVMNAEEVSDLIGETLAKKREVYGSEYSSEYLGVIRYSEYNLRRD